MVGKLWLLFFIYMTTSTLCLSVVKIFFEEFPIKETLASTDFNFAAVGDWGCNSNTRNIVNVIVDKNPEIVLGLGDYSYNFTADCWLNIVNPIIGKMKIAIGNHEHVSYPSMYGNIRSSYLLNQYLTRFGLEKEYYSFNFQNVHFAVMSTEVPFRIGSEQYNFITNDLKSTSTNPNIKWIVVIFHQPIYTSPSIILPNVPNVIFRDIYHPLFDKYDVDIVLEGHIHNYQRSYPLEYNSSNSSSPIVTTLEKKYYHNPEGTIFIIAGTGGESLYSFRGKSYFTVIQLLTFGFINIDMANNGLTMNATYYANGIIKDQFLIDKSLPDKDRY